MRRQRPLDIGQIADREMDGQCCAGAAQFFQCLARRHGGRLHGGAGEDHRLRDLGKRELRLQRGGHCGEGGHARCYVIGDAELVETADLLGDGAIERGVARVDARHVLALRVGGLDLRDDLIQRHGGRIDHACALGCGFHDLLRHKRARIEADGAGLDDLQAPHGDEVGCAGAGADEMDGHSAASLFFA